MYFCIINFYCTPKWYCSMWYFLIRTSENAIGSPCSPFFIQCTVCINCQVKYLISSWSGLFAILVWCIFTAVGTIYCCSTSDNLTEYRWTLEEQLNKNFCLAFCRDFVVDCLPVEDLHGNSALQRYRIISRTVVYKSLNFNLPLVSEFSELTILIGISQCILTW